MAADRMPAYATTDVPVGRSQEEIRGVLRAHDSDGFSFGEARKGDTRYATVGFEHGGYRVAMLVPIRVPGQREVDRIEQRAKKRRGWLIPEEWAERRVWRIIAWGLRARLVAVEEGVETFEEAFLPHIVNPATGRTIYCDLMDEGRVELPSALPALDAGDTE